MDNSPLQVMDLTSLKAVLVDLRKKIIPSRFEKAQQPEANTLQLAFRTIESVVWVELSWDASSARLVEIPPPARSFGESTLAKQINHGLRQMALIELKQEGFERVIEFGFALRPNQKLQRFLTLELMGRHSNFFMLNKERQTITLGRQIRNHQSRLRPISTGDPYTQPPQPNGIKPDKSESFLQWKHRLCLLPITLKDSFLQNFQGVSPSLILQLASEDKDIAEKIANRSVKDIPDQTWRFLYKRWLIWLDHIEKESFSLFFKGPTAYKVWNCNIDTSLESKEVSISLGYYYQKKLALKKFKELSRDLNKKLLKIKEIEEIQMKKQKCLLGNIPQNDLLKNQADTILCSKNPSKEQVKKAQALYKKAKKMRRSESVLIERIDHHTKKIDLINESELFLNEIISSHCDNDSEKVKAICELKDEVEKHLFPSKKKTPSSNSKAPSSLILELTSPSGLIIQIGRNHRQNELISLKEARKGDIWFHAQECPGSHVVMKASNGIYQENDLQMGADLAAFFSRAKLNKKVSIIMAHTNQLQKLKGAMPGTVNHKGGKVLWGNPLNGEDHFKRATANAQNALSSAPS